MSSFRDHKIKAELGKVSSFVHTVADNQAEDSKIHLAHWTQANIVSAQKHAHSLKHLQQMKNYD